MTRKRLGQWTNLSVLAMNSLLLLLLIIGVLTPVSEALSSSREEIGFFDGLRVGSSGDVRTRTLPGSSVVEVTLATKNNQTNDEAAGAGHSDDAKEEGVYRLCHLATMLPISDAIGRPGWSYALNSAAAALLAVKHFNSRHDAEAVANSGVVPDLSTNDRIKDCNVRLTIEHQDTWRSSIAANRVLVKDLLSRDGSWPGAPRPVALVGAALSPVSASLSILASNSQIPVISPLSQSSILDNKGTYALFGRTNPGSVGDARAVASYLRNVLDVTHCGVLFVRDVFGSAYSSDFARVAEFELKPPLHVTSVAFDSDGNHESIRFAVARLADSGLNYIFCITHFHHFEVLVKEASRQDMIGSGKFWIFPSQISSNEGDVARSISGATFLTFNLQPNEHFDDAWRTLEEDSSLKEYFVASQPEYLDLRNFTFPPSPSLIEALTYDAVMALGFAACESSEYFFDGPSLFDAFLKTSFTGATGEVGFNPLSGSRKSSQTPYRVSNIIATNTEDPSAANGTEGGGDVALTFREVAHQVKSGDDGSDDGPTMMEWVTTKPTTYADGTDIAPPVLPPQNNHIDNAISVGAIAFGLMLAGLGACASVLCGAWTALHRWTRVVRSSQPQFLLMLCAGSFITSCSIVPLSLQEPVSRRGLDVACMASPWLFSLGWVMSFSALFSKTLRIHKLLKMSGNFCRITVKPMDVLPPFLALFTCNVVVLTVWTLFARLRWERVDVASSVDSFGRANESYAMCQYYDHSAWPFAIVLVLMDVGCMMYAVIVSYRARNIPTEYHETHYITIAVGSILQAFMLGVPILAVSSQSPQASFVTNACLASTVCFAVLIPLFGPKAQAWRNEMKARKLKSSITEEKEKRRALSKKNQRLQEELRTSYESIRAPRCTKMTLFGSDADLCSSMNMSTHNRGEAWVQHQHWNSFVCYN